VKKRIFALGERFREIDEFLEAAARGWIKRYVKSTDAGPLHFQREPYRALPSALRKKILQFLCFERIGVSPNERLLESMDRILGSAGPSARLNIGKGATLRCRYDQATLEIGGRPARTGVELLTEEKVRISTANLKRLAKGENAAAFDGDGIRLPLSVRPLKAGDRIRPFGLDAEKKVKEILIDRKVPREDRWGRHVVCDALGTILWIPGVVRSADAPVTDSTRRTIVVKIERLIFEGR
jgi:tRNA(Ile)-lysidine synthase